MQLGRLLRYLVVFGVCAALLAVAGGVAGFWQSADHATYAALRLSPPTEPDAGLHVLDLPYPDELKHEENPESFRAAIGTLLQALASWTVAPRVVLIDVWFSRHPAGAESVLQGIAALRARGTLVFAAVHPASRHDSISDNPLALHHPEIYRAVDGYGHTVFDHAFGLLKYDREVTLPVRAGGAIVGRTTLPALPPLAVLGAERVVDLPAAIVVPLGDDASLAPHLHRVALATSGAAGATGDTTLAPIAGATHIIIGSLAEDSDNVLARPGPLLLAWAVSDLLAGRASRAAVPLADSRSAIFVALLAAAVAATAFLAGFHPLRPRIAPRRWRALAIVLGLAAFAVAGAVLVALNAALIDVGRVAPIAFPLACAALASALATHSAFRWVDDADARQSLQRESEERAIDYDVFVSYAHDPPENKRWVKQEVMARLATLRHSNGRPYRVFFDESGISPGRRWKREIELALLGTRCFVPVFCGRYFERPYCREEIELADQLRIEGRLQFVPIARELSGIPERYLRKVQYLDARNRVQFGEAFGSLVKASVDYPDDRSSRVD